MELNLYEVMLADKKNEILYRYILYIFYKKISRGHALWYQTT